MKKLDTLKFKLARKAAITAIRFLLGESSLNLDSIIAVRAGGEKVVDAASRMKEKVENMGWQYPLKWLLHYLEGEGTDLLVPNNVVEDASVAFTAAINNDVRFEKSASSIWRDGSNFYVNHSLMYGVDGFEDKPILFYLLGGFTFHLNADHSIYAEDVYDWHPNKGEEKEYFSSPLGEEFGELFALLNQMFPYNWFTEDGDVSNKFFSDMELVGAKPFTSKIIYKDGLLIDEINRSFECRFERYQRRSARIREGRPSRRPRREKEEA